jgi:transporter family protein
MKEWLLPTLGTITFMGLWSFVPKITTKYLNPTSATIYEAIGGLLLGLLLLLLMNSRLEVHPKGIALAIATGVIGFMGAFCFLSAMAKGSVAIVSTLSALYPVVSIFLAMVFLHETVSLRQGLGIALALLSIILVAA